MTDRAKLIEVLSNADLFNYPERGSKLIKCAAAQIEADGARETALLDISARFAEMTARAIKAETEIERLNAIIHGMQDGALVRDQAALIERLEADNASLRDQIEQGQAGRVAMTERAWQQDRRIESLEAALREIAVPLHDLADNATRRREIARKALG